MSVYVCIYVSVYVYLNVSLCMWVCAHTCEFVCVSLCVCVSMISQQQVSEREQRVSKLDQTRVYRCRPDG